MEKEIRLNNISNEETGRHVTGYAIVFNSLSENLGFFETIYPSAIDEDTIKRSDVLAKFNHSDDKVLARSKYGEGSLTLTIDEKGLRYDFEAPHTALGDELLEYLKRGDINSSSFAFTVSQEEGSERWYKKDGQVYRDIYKIDKLYDISPVFCPAYTETTCSARAKEMLEKADEIESKLNLLIEEINQL